MRAVAGVEVEASRRASRALYSHVPVPVVRPRVPRPTHPATCATLTSQASRRPRRTPRLQPRALAARRRLQRVDLALQARDLRRFLRPRERVLVEAERIARLARAPVRVTQVLGDGRIVARQLDRPLELLDGVPVVAALIVDPAEAVHVEAVVRLDLE